MVVVYKKKKRNLKGGYYTNLIKGIAGSFWLDKMPKLFIQTFFDFVHLYFRTEFFAIYNVWAKAYWEWGYSENAIRDFDYALTLLVNKKHPIWVRAYYFDRIIRLLVNLFLLS